MNTSVHVRAQPEEVERQLGCLKSQGAKPSFSMGIMSYRGHCLMEPRPNNVPLLQMQVRVPGLSLLFQPSEFSHLPGDRSARTVSGLPPHTTDALTRFGNTEISVHALLLINYKDYCTCLQKDDVGGKQIVELPAGAFCLPAKPHLEQPGHTMDRRCLQCLVQICDDLKSPF